MWVAAVPGTLSGLLTEFTLGSTGSELLLFLAPFQACWQSLPLALQPVSCCCPWHPFKPANQAYPWLCREWVAGVSDIFSSLLTTPTLGSAVCELLLSLRSFQACWSNPLLAMQYVSWLSLRPFQACLSSWFLILQYVSCCCPWYHFNPTHQSHLWPCREWVAVVLSILSSLLTKLTLGSAESELLLFLAPC